jgi:hypothetical protein
MSPKHGFPGSSPSSGGAESTRGTPETRITPFSSVKSINDKTDFLFNSSKSISTASILPVVQDESDSTDKDPFISTNLGIKAEPSVLSPTASTFQPFGLRIQGINHPPMVVKSPGPPATSYLSQQPAGSSSRVNEAGLSSGVDSSNTTVSQSGTFSTDSNSITRALRVSGFNDSGQASSVQACVQVCIILLAAHCVTRPSFLMKSICFSTANLQPIFIRPSSLLLAALVLCLIVQPHRIYNLVRIFLFHFNIACSNRRTPSAAGQNANCYNQKACSRTKGSLKFVRAGTEVLIRFSDIMDAINAYNEVQAAHPEWLVDFITPAAFAEVCKSSALSN